MSKYRKGTN